MKSGEQLPNKIKPHWRGYWFGLCSGIVANFGVSTVLTGLVLFLDSAASVAFERQPFLNNMEDAGTKAWFLMLSIQFLSACVAGFVTVRFSPPRSNRAWMTLLILAVASSIFAQFPQPASAAVLVIWLASAPLGVLCGWLLVRRSALLL